MKMEYSKLCSHGKVQQKSMKRLFRRITIQKESVLFLHLLEKNKTISGYMNDFQLLSIREVKSKILLPRVEESRKVYVSNDFFNY
ncbi:hypothetical protein QQG55_48855 [Brugia pahangi]